MPPLPIHPSPQTRSDHRGDGAGSDLFLLTLCGAGCSPALRQVVLCKLLRAPREGLSVTAGGEGGIRQPPAPKRWGEQEWEKRG